MPSNRLILCRPLFLLPSIFLTISVFSSELGRHIRWPKYWSFTFNINPSSEYSGLISFWMDCLDLLAVQGTLKSLLQHHSSKASILQCSAFFIVQLSHPCITIGWNAVLKKIHNFLTLFPHNLWFWCPSSYLHISFWCSVFIITFTNRLSFFFICMLVNLSDLISNCDSPYIFLLHFFSASFILLFIFFCSAFVSANEFSNFSWHIIVSSSFLQYPAFLSTAFLNSFSVFVTCVLNLSIRLKRSVSLFVPSG